MKITAIRFAGFRGARHEVSLKLPLGFVVVEGRNGSGKSTLCDAIEFALSGTIRGSSGHTEKGEGIRDYTWWRGSPRHGDSFVEITLCDTEGRACTVRRTPNGVSVQPDLGLEEVLCSSSTALESPLLQLCRTTILRDEEITQLSVDLRESERFEFVRAALGTADLSTIERKTKDALELVGAEVLREERVYSDARDRVADILTRLSRARVEAARTANVPSAEALLRDSLGLPDCTADELADRSEARLSELRARTDQLTRLCARLQLFEQRKAALDAEKQQSAIRLLAEAAAAAADRVSAFEKEAAAATEALAAAQTESPQNASLALLREHGERVGLLGGRCPLCGTAQPEETFRAHLHILADKITRSNGILTSLTKSSAEASAQLLAMRAELSKRSAQLTAAREQMFAMSAEWEALLHDARELGLSCSDDDRLELATVAHGIELAREQTTRIENALAVVNASRAIEHIATLEQEEKVAREQLVAMDKRVSNVRAVVSQVKHALDTIRRVRGEYVNEQLAQLEPLLLELYQRLRPHVDWPDIRYRLRGDVRRMLSFEVGDGLNPSFVFSSGQRRAAGLAFLLAVHLSRNWCALRTLILDDPVQHIDDYRALHLTEVLAAIRVTGRQVICTVEDESLARLLARRLRSTPDEQGAIVHMAYSSAIGVHVATTVPVHPLPGAVLVPA